MMYSSNLAAALIVDGKVLREFGDVVYMPFGSEYSIRLKNLNNKRALVKIEIDGEEVTGSGIVVDAFKSVDLERFIRNGNLSQGNRFKFVERSQKVEEHRGIKTEDGIISIRYEFEAVKSYPISKGLSTPTDLYSMGVSDLCSMGISATTATTRSGLSPQSVLVNSSLPVNDTGITVEGSISNQSFSTTRWGGSDGHKHVLNLRVLGETEDNLKIRQPVTVKTKLECKTCGTVNPATSKFCSECGTSLSIV